MDVFWIVSFIIYIFSVIWFYYAYAFCHNASLWCFSFNVSWLLQSEAL